MNKIDKYLIFTLVCLVANTGLKAGFIKDVSKVGTTGAPFLEIEAGARSIGMGGAFVALADDATATYWNPAGMVKVNGNEAIFNHVQWLADINYDYVSFISNFDGNNAFGVSYTGLSMGDMKVRTVQEPEGTGEKFSAGSMALGLSYSRRLTDRFTIGFTGKYINENIYHESTSAFAMDIGTQFRTPFKNMIIGMSISNFGNKMKMVGKDLLIKHDIDENIEGNNDRISGHLDTDKWSLPLLLRIGVAMDILNTRYNRVTISTDAMHPNDNLESINIGGEYSFREFLFLRAGYTNLFLKDGEESLAAGAGINYQIRNLATIKLDYAYSDFGILNDVHRFSISLKF
ncbi:MAG: PorV/PorQ family protein [Candidatus Marinimicrobia bacterium]|nr:PorV/PorQ family protein [Candidatus Neomarinimicrobiota bacterium]